MALRDVADFVTHDARQFAFGLRRGNQPRVYGDKAPGHGKRVERPVSHRKEKEVKGRHGPCGHQSPPQAIEVIRNFRVGQVIFVGADFLHKGFADVAFVLQRQIGPRHRAEAREI